MNEYQITGKKLLSDDIAVFQLSPVAKELLTFQPGQYCLISDPDFEKQTLKNQVNALPLELEIIKKRFSEIETERAAE